MLVCLEILHLCIVDFLVNFLFFKCIIGSIAFALNWLWYVGDLDNPIGICRFLQGPETDMSTVDKIREAIREQKEITVQLINYTKSGKFCILTGKTRKHEQLTFYYHRV
jgi:hypothetical protein